MNATLFAILLYVLAQLGIGWWVSRRIRTEDDYLVAGRSLGFGLATFTVFATWFGAETCIGAAGRIYESGLSGGSADPFGYALCLILMGLVFAVPLWKRRLTTMADLFRQRFSPAVERLAVLLMVPTSLLWAAAQIRAFGQVISSSSGLQVELTITVAALVVIVYTVSGGLLADAITDLVQGVALTLGLGVLLVAVLKQGGAEAIARIEPQRLQLLGGDPVPWYEVAEAWAIPVFGSVVAAELVARVLASRTPTIARNSFVMAGGGYLAIGLIPVTLGLIGAEILPGLDDPEQILPRLAQLHLPGVLYVLFAGALLSAILSTVDSTLLVSSSLVSHNIIVPLRPVLTEVWKVRSARIGVAVFGVGAYAMALHAEGVYALVEQASAFGSAGIVVIVTFGLFTRFGGPASALAALVAGVGVWIVGSYVLGLSWAYLAALAASVAGYVMGALFEQSRSVATVSAGVILAILGFGVACDRGAAEERALLSGDWSELVSMPHPRTENSAAAADGRIWVMGGFEARHEAETAVDVFDPRTGGWDTPTRLPLGVNHAGLAEVGGRLYLIGGYRHGTFEAIDRVQIYDVARGVWTEGAPMPTGRGALAVAVVDGRIHAIGGVESGGAVSAAQEVYDPASDTWEPRAQMPTPREHLAAAAHGGRIYAAAGRSRGRNLDAFEIYDVAADGWSKGPDVPTARSGVAAAVVDGRFYLFGGEEIFGFFKDTFDEAERFDPAIGAWEAVQPMPTARHGLGAAVLDGAIYVVGGGPEPGFTFSGTNERFEP